MPKAKGGAGASGGSKSGKGKGAEGGDGEGKASKGGTAVKVFGYSEASYDCHSNKSKVPPKIYPLVYSGFWYQFSVHLQFFLRP